MESAPASATNPALPDDSSESNNYSPVPYGERDALCFKEELEETQRELEDVSKKAGIAGSNGSISASSYWRPLTVKSQ
jgi:hypothetical protein